MEAWKSRFLFDAVRKTTDPDNFYYVHTAVHLNPNREIQFNGVENKRTKNVKISGLKLIFDVGKDKKKQMAFQGKRAHEAGDGRRWRRTTGMIAASI